MGTEQKNKKHRKSLSWIWKSKTGWQEKGRSGSNASQSTSGDASPFLETLSRWWHRSHGSNCQSSEVSSAVKMACSTSQRQRRLCTRCQDGCQARNSQPRKAQEESGTRNVGHIALDMLCQEMLEAW